MPLEKAHRTDLTDDSIKTKKKLRCFLIFILNMSLNQVEIERKCFLFESLKLTFPLHFKGFSVLQEHDGIYL